MRAVLAAVEVVSPLTVPRDRAASFLLGRELPPVPWLSRGFLRAYGSEKPASWDLLDDDDVWQHPVIRETIPGRAARGVRLVHASRERLYGIRQTVRLIKINLG